MSELRELYQSVILDHNNKPRNFGALATANRHAEGHNPLCGDDVTVHLTVEDETVKEVRFEGRGCAISTASASLMTEAIKGKSTQEVMALFDDFHELVTTPPKEEVDAQGLGKLSVFSGVREFPMRVKCATLCWHTMRSALDGSGKSVTTE
jgi:nitrogen fixation NifU-like protein